MIDWILIREHIRWYELYIMILGVIIILNGVMTMGGIIPVPPEMLSPNRLWGMCVLLSGMMLLQILRISSLSEMISRLKK